jgi:adenine deaminase
MADKRASVVSVARGEAPADLILANASIINVFSGETESGNVAIFDGVIAGIGGYHEARHVIELGGKYVAPGFIDGHGHLESSMLDVPEYARAVVPRGTLAIVTDLHEIANVCGIGGLRYVLDSGRGLPLDIFLQAPSCVPATSLETSGASLDFAALKRVFRLRQCTGLGEMMNFPGVLFQDKEVLEKIGLARSHPVGGRPVDGHAPGLSGKDLNAYVAAGICSDHESVSLDEAREKLRLGMHVMIREGSSERNLKALLPLVTDKTYPRCMFVVDDRSCADILEDGDLDAVVRKAVRLGIDPVRAIQLATINPARYFGLRGLGAVAPGYRANLVITSDLESLPIDRVFYLGSEVAAGGQPLFQAGRTRPPGLRSTVNVRPFSIEALQIQAGPGNARSELSCRVIQVVPGQIVTGQTRESLSTVDGQIMTDATRDILKLAVIERHRATGNIGLGLVQGFEMQRGALASSIAHDSHNIVAVGVDDHSIFTAVQQIVRTGGGVVAAEGGEVLSSLALPIAGLLSDRPLEATVKGLGHVEAAAAGLGCRLPSPLSTLSFLALPVIPELRLTDLGLVDVNRFALVDILS